MSDICYRVRVEKILGSECFSDASREELRVLLALVSLGGRPVGIDELARESGASVARVRSSLTLWAECGVIAEQDGFAFVTEEFEGTSLEDGSASVASDIRDEGLAELIAECGLLLERPALSTDEIKALTSLYTEQSLSFEYILALAAYLVSKSSDGAARVTVKKLVREAEKLARGGVDTLESLEAFVRSESERTEDEWEYRRVLGIWNRSLSRTEREYFRHWAKDLCYSVAIAEEAYDIAVRNTGKVSLPYMNKLLEAWHAEGCKTVAECRASAASESARLKSEHTKARTAKSTEAKTPKYSEFDSEDALMRAIERSYSEKKTD